MANHIVAHFADGTLVKGTSLNVDITRPSCHVRKADGSMHEVRFADLKALFFVKSETGDPAHVDALSIAAADPRARGAHVVEVRFKDGERLVGLSNRYPPAGPLFFLVPADAASNNLRILINRAQADTIGKPADAGS